MYTEFEIKFIKIDKDEIRSKLEKIWAKCVKKETLMKRVIFDLWERKYIRIRYEWDKITCTYKEVAEDTSKIDCVKELETTVGDFETIRQIFIKSGLRQKSYQENKREVWEIKNECEFMIDTWPWLNPFIEIEWNDEKIVKKYVDLLWFDYENWLFGSLDVVAEKELQLDKNYVNNKKEITFNNPL